MSATSPIESILWIVVLSLWTITGLLDLISRARKAVNK